MTREEAIEFLRSPIKCSDKGDERDLREAMDMAIKFLEQKPCEDCISRSEAIKMFKYNYKGERIPDYDCDNFPVQIAIKTVKEMLRGLPPVTPAEKVGHWIYIGNSEVNGLKICKCSNCEKKTYGSHKFCPNCGIKMEESLNG